jgi:predicted house-cleaning noncanonical NTP pyrophosphatase (MazG superfamily)
MGLPKLVRDLIPRHIEDDGMIPICSVADDKLEHINLLCDKMDEEMKEFMLEPSLEEAGDIYEVLRAIVELHGMRMEDVIIASDRKMARSGGFSGGIILERVDEKK